MWLTARDADWLLKETSSMRDVTEEAGAMSPQGTPRESRFSEGSKPPSQAPHPSSGREPPAHQEEGPFPRAGPSPGARPGRAGQARRPWGSRAVLAALGPEPSRSFLKAASASAAVPPFPGLGPSARSCRRASASPRCPSPLCHPPCPKPVLIRLLPCISCRPRRVTAKQEQ